MNPHNPFLTPTQALALANGHASAHMEVSSWRFKINTKIPYSEIVKNLADSGLNPQMARILAPTYVFTRTVRAIGQRELVDNVRWTKDEVTFQISYRVRAADGIDYQRRCLMTLDRSSSEILCDVPSLKQMAETEFHKQSGVRKTTDLNRLLARIVRKHLNDELFPLEGNSYIAGPKHKSLFDSIEKFVLTCGGAMRRLVFPESINTETIKKIVVDSLEETLLTVQTAVEDVNTSTGKTKLANVRKELSAIEDNLVANRARIGNQLAVLEDHLARLDYLLRNNKTKPATPSEMPPQDAGNVTTVNSDDNDDSDNESDDFAGLDWVPTPVIDPNALPVVTGINPLYPY